MPENDQPDLTQPVSVPPFDPIRRHPGSAALPDRSPIQVTLQRTDQQQTSDQGLWVVIRNRTNAVQFNNYKAYIDGFSTPSTPLGRLGGFGFDAYQFLRYATELYLMQEVGVATTTMYNQIASDSNALADEQSRLGRPITGGDLLQMRNQYLQNLTGNSPPAVLPYLKLIRERLSELPLKAPSEVPSLSYGVSLDSLTSPILLELLFCYWLEAGMLVQSMNVIALRFQNRRTGNGRNPLTNLEIDPLRLLGSNILWNYIRSEQDRLTVLRRAFEYEHEYGLELRGKAVGNVHPADKRSRFLETFHTLLYLTSQFYKQDDDTTKIADGFPVLKGLTDLHMLLAQGAGNQRPELTLEARAEFLVIEWILSRPEIREFLGSRIMVPYREPWMDRVDLLRSLFGWGDVSITHFRDLADYGEKILLSVRFANWSVVNDGHQAANWARYFRPEIQGYIYAYKAVTGVDLSTLSTDTRPLADKFRQPIEYLTKGTRG
jgi:hypothetical protein